jgi:hypothetical protein
LGWAALGCLRRQRHFRNCFGVKDKRAAQGRRSGNHCGRHKILGRFQGTPGLEPTEAVFAFYSPLRILLRRGGFVKLDAEKSF